MVNAFRNQFEILEEEDFEDLFQECLTHWFFVRQKHDKKRASSGTFMNGVLRNKLYDIIKEKRADKRKMTSVSLSLDRLLENGGEGEVIPKDEGISEVFKLDISGILLRTFHERLYICFFDICRCIFRGITF